MGRVKVIPFEAGAKLLARDRYSSDELNVKVVNIKDKQNIKIIMDWFNLSRIDAEAVYSHLRDREDDVGRRPPLSDKAREVLHRIEVINL